MMNKARNHNIMKRICSVTMIIVVAKLLGFIKQMIMAGTFGATIETDLIMLSQNLIGHLDYLLVQVFSTSFIPIYIRISQKSEEESNAFVLNVLKIMTLISMILSIALVIGAPIISRVLASSYSDELIRRLTVYIRIYSPTLILMVVSAVFNALLKARERFNHGEFASVLQSLVVISISLMVGKKFGAIALMLSFWVYQIVSIWFFASSAKGEWKKVGKTSLIDDNIKSLVKVSGPLLLGYSMIFINQYVDQIIVSGLGDGAITSLGYAAVLINLITTLVGSVCVVIFTYVSKHIAAKDNKQAADLIIKASVLFTTLLIPVSLIFIFYSKDIISIVFARGAFSETAVNYASAALSGYGVCIVFLAYRELFSRFQYAYLDSKQPMINTSIGIVFNIGLSIALSRVIGILGVTIATSCSVIICAVLNIVKSKKHNIYIRNIIFRREAILWIVGGMISIFVSNNLRNLLSDLGLYICFFVSSIVCILLFALINMPTIMKMIKSIKQSG